MILEEKIKITEVKELAKIGDVQSQKSVNSVRDSLRNYIGNRINLAVISSLLDKVGKKLLEGGWKTLNIFIPIKSSEDPTYKKYNKSLIYCVMLPFTRWEGTVWDKSSRP